MNMSINTGIGTNINIAAMRALFELCSGMNETTKQRLSTVHSIYSI